MLLIVDYNFIYWGLVSFVIVIVNLVVRVSDATEIEVVSFGRLAIMPVLNIIEEVLGGIKPLSAGDEATDETSEDCETERHSESG